jgi:beta-lactamase regulating signal transducer with metallopeptidase domain
MLIAPIVCTAILLRTWRWAELATLTAAFSAMAAKDPLVLLFRQRFVWRQRRPESAAALRWFCGWSLLFLLSALVILAAWPFRALLAIGLGIAAYSALAIFVNVTNRQRSTLFQIASAAALTSTSLATSLSGISAVAPWCWGLWILLALQAAAGILVVHARLDARLALRSPSPSTSVARSRRAAHLAAFALAAAAIAALFLRRYLVAAALLLAGFGYFYDLRRQREPAYLQMPLTRVGLRALALSSLYGVLLILALW